MSRSPDGDRAREHLELLCAIIEEGTRRIEARAYGGRVAVEPLIAGGHLVDDGPVRSVVCDACDDIHTALVERDHATGRWRSRCPTAGVVPLEDEDVAALVVSVECLADALAEAVGRRRPRQPPLAGGRVWQLGDFTIGATEATGILVCRTSDAESVALVSDALRSMNPAAIAIAFSTGAAPGDAVALPAGFRCVSLSEVARLDRTGRLTVDVGRFGRFVQRSHAERKTAGGRPPFRDGVTKVRRELAERGLRFSSQGAEAKAVRQHWSEVFPDRQPPSTQTVERYIRKERQRSAA